MGDRRAIFITGGGSGIGRAVAVYFGQRGWFVGLGVIDKAGMRETEEMIANGFVYSHPLDVRDRSAWDEALDAFCVAAGGRIDVLFNNAGVPLGGSLTENSAEEIERTLDINLKGAWNCCKAVLPGLIEQGGGAILNIASTHAFTIIPHTFPYPLAKHALLGFNRIPWQLGANHAPSLEIICFNLVSLNLSQNLTSRIS